MRRGYLYRLQSKDEKIREIYISSTWDFTISEDYHRNACSIPEHPEYNKKVHIFIREHGGWSNWDLIELYAFTCAGITERLTKEQSYRGNCLPSLNDGRNIKHVQHNEIKDEIAVFDVSTKKRRYIKQPTKKTNKEYYQENKERLLAIQNKKEECICGCIVSHGNMKQHQKSIKHKNLIKTI
tara:strand:- start:603 stop:1148 length:546 start_codon:yes stop_codon:yes gene_type:complete